MFARMRYSKVLTAIANGDKTVEADGVNYTVENEGSAAMVHTADGADYAYVSVNLYFPILIACIVYCYSQCIVILKAVNYI